MSKRVAFSVALPGFIAIWYLLTFPLETVIAFSKDSILTIAIAPWAAAIAAAFLLLWYLPKHVSTRLWWARSRSSWRYGVSSLLLSGILGFVGMFLTKGVLAGVARFGSSSAVASLHASITSATAPTFGFRWLGCRLPVTVRLDNGDGARFCARWPVAIIPDNEILKAGSQVLLRVRTNSIATILDSIAPPS